MVRLIKRNIIILLLSICIGFALVYISNLLPTSRAVDHCRDSVEILAEEGVYPSDIYSEHQLDNWTDCIMLSVCAYDSQESVLKKSINAPYLRLPNKNPCDSFLALFGGGDISKAYQHDYPRYWHGYQVILRPLLNVMNYTQIRQILMIGECMLLVLVIHLSMKKSPESVIPFLIFILLIAPTAISSSLQFSGVYIIALCFSIIVLSRWELDEKNVGLFFLSGILTAYIDFLTAPTLTLTVPLCFLCIRFNQQGENIRDSFKAVLLCVVFWGVGYLGMWGAKWVISGVYGGTAFWSSLIDQFRFRASATNSQGEHVSRLFVLRKNLKCLFDNPYLVCLSIIYLFTPLIFTFKKNGHFLWKKTILFFIPISVSIAWNLFTTNHSNIHYWFTYRTLAPSVFCVLAAMNMACSGPHREVAQ